MIKKSANTCGAHLLPLAAQMMMVLQKGKQCF